LIPRFTFHSGNKSNLFDDEEDDEEMNDEYDEEVLNQEDFHKAFSDDNAKWLKKKVKSSNPISSLTHPSPKIPTKATNSTAMPKKNS
jgi:hypothetical protein